MKKHVFGRKLKRDTNERAALFKNLLTSLVLQERIKTTLGKAKAIRPAADKLITKAKKGGSDAYRGLESEINHDAVKKLITDIAPRFMNRQGGYTRIIKIGRRVADNTSMVVMEWTERSMALVVSEGEEAQGKKDKKEVKGDELQATVKGEGTMKTKKQTKKVAKKSVTGKDEKEKKEKKTRKS